MSNKRSTRMIFLLKLCALCSLLKYVQTWSNMVFGNFILLSTTDWTHSPTKESSKCLQIVRYLMPKIAKVIQTIHSNRSNWPLTFLHLWLSHTNLFSLYPGLSSPSSLSRNLKYKNQMKDVLSSLHCFFSIQSIKFDILKVHSHWTWKAESDKKKFHRGISTYLFTKFTYTYF